MHNKHIVILGGGFAGVTCAIQLSRQFGNGKDVRITVVDKEPYHWFHADFYEVASSPEEVTDIANLKESVALPLLKILKQYGVVFVKGEVLAIDAKNRTVEVRDKDALDYTYLVCALGSTACFYNIPGALEYTIPLKSFSDALKVRNNIEFAIQRHRQDTTKRELRIAVIGGGFSGVELAAELVGMVSFLSWKYTYPREKIDVCILEGATQLLPGLPEKVSRDTSRRLRDLGVRLQLNARIISVTDRLIELQDGQKVSFDAAVWTAGVQAVLVPFTQVLPKDRSGRVFLTDTLQVEQYHNIFFIGDGACTGQCPDPPTAMHAMHQAKYVAYALPRVMLNKKPKAYQAKEFSYIIPLGGKFAIYSGPNFYTAGYAGYILKLWRTFKYYKSLVGTFKALSYLTEKQKLYSRND